MRWSDLSLVGYVHTLTCVLALLIGAFMIFGRKGTALHRRVGRWYVGAMLVANLSAFGIIRGGLDIFHGVAAATLVMLVVGFVAASRQKVAAWAYLHPLGMIASYYSLVGGAINEAFARIDVLRSAALSSSPGAGLLHTRLVGTTHSVNMLVFFTLLMGFLAQVARHRRQATRLEDAAPVVDLR
jgi:uncharacterized membrane protein